MASQLDSLKAHSVVVADTGDIDAVARKLESWVASNLVTSERAAA